MKKNPQKIVNKTPKDYEQIGRMVENIYESGYADRNQTYKMSFVKGLLGGLGGVIGATVVVALGLWVLSFFHETPLIGRLVDNIRSTVNSRSRCASCCSNHFLLEHIGINS